MVTSPAMPKQILVIEDDQDIRDSLCDVLDMLGHPVVTANNGQVALQMLETLRPGLILLDLMMPVLDGWGFKEQHAANPEISHIPVILITADGNAIERAAKMNANAGLKKPIELDLLIKAIQKFCV